jgi:O-succinylbenzoate synthase
METVSGVRVKVVELIRIRMPLVAPFRTSFGSTNQREVVLVHVIAADSEGWGECVAMEEPLYSPEYVDAAQHVLRHHLLPRLFAAGDLVAEQVAPTLVAVKGHQMAKAALEMAWLDAQLRAEGRSFGSYIGATREAVECGVSVGIFDDNAQLLNAVRGYVEQGYRRIKLKIEPGRDIDAVRAVREMIGPDMRLQVDANTAYTAADGAHLAQLDEFDLLLIEQPLPEDQLLAHARLAQQVRTPICLDESITSAIVADEAIDMGACSIINIKAGRVGGYIEATRVHDVCRRRGIPVWCGGMLETGIGRAANVALAAMPNFTLPGDTSASDRFYREDITAPFILQDGMLRVPTGPGLGVEVLPEVVSRISTARETIRPG